MKTMDRLNEIVITLVMCIIIFLIGVSIGFLKSYTEGYMEGVRDTPACICDCPEIYCPPCVCEDNNYCPPEPQFLRIARDVAEEVEYDRENWNCLDKSNEIIRRLENSKWKGKFEVVRGLVLTEKELKDGTIHKSWVYHAWVCTKNRDICIEATTGRIIDPELYEMNYREDK